MTALQKCCRMWQLFKGTAEYDNYLSVFRMWKKNLKGIAEYDSTSKLLQNVTALQNYCRLWQLFKHIAECDNHLSIF